MMHLLAVNAKERYVWKQDKPNRTDLLQNADPLGDTYGAFSLSAKTWMLGLDV